MRIRIALILLSMLLFNAVPTVAPAAEEELFDTEAAASAREQGVEALRHKKYDKAIAAFEEAIAASPDAESYYLMGYAYYLKGKAGDKESREKAAEIFSEVYQIDPIFSPNKYKAEVMIAPEAEAFEPSSTAGAETTMEKPMKEPVSMSSSTETMDQPSAEEPSETPMQPNMPGAESR